MANRFATLLGNTKTRTMVLLVLGVLIFGVVIAVSQTDSSDTGPATQRTSRTTEVPNQVKSTPGSEVSRNYQELQEKANVRGAAEAAKKGTTFIPTLTGNAVGPNDQDFEKQLTTAFDSLGGKCSKEKVAELAKNGMTTTQILLELKSYGCSAAAIAALFTPDQIAAALLAEKSCGSAEGCTAEAVKSLKGQGNDISKVVAAMKANGCAPNDIAIALKESGSDAATIVKAMKENGFTPNEIATALKKSGSDAATIAAAMKANGIDAATVATALARAGFSKAEILPALTQAGFSPIEVARALSALNLDQADTAALSAQQQAQAAASQRLLAQQEAQQLAAFSQQRQGKIQDLITAMESEKKTALDVWSQIPTQAFQQGDWASTKATALAAAQNAAGSKGKSATGFEDGKVILKAGSILFAVLDTAVNSDQAGPVMATVVAGSLKGSKLLGSMSSDTISETIALSFTAINMPNEANSMGINAVAIDPDTARTALASDVDHHYLYRWGSLLASSFVQGYASAVASTNSTSTTSQGAAGTTTTTSTQAPDAKQQLFAGISAVGTKWSQVVGQNFDRPITITIDQGTGIGVLVTSDLTYGTNPIFYSTAPTTTAAAAAAPEGAAAPAAGTSLNNDQRQALLNLLQNQPATASNTTVSNTPTGGTVVNKTGGGNTP